ncbi:protein kinase [Kitasatospora sp. RG8]|uniref:serine/threonine-protein kinase n=1 Tax=Kitasatospora sp. RG8 TaxID=2820815 RepID=UPI001ADEF180|nr:serine/threonine-protein kinase [Kitasatospora sp. RG8]MBP0454191.1 protein kinase [Kitasatospora sp. RG8]
MEQLVAADPRHVGPYALMGRLGAGGMGAVYLGRSAGGRAVAVKVVRPELAEDGSFRSRFRQEVAAARRVSGAFTAPLVDADTEAATPWMATAFVAGVPLQQAVARHGPLPEETVRTLAAGLAEALAEVHRAGLIHRDLKPGNVLLALDGPHVIDFGISRAADGTGLTTTGAVIGSAPYMSPEQALGEPLTPASDVFSLGSTVAYAALGSRLFGEGAGAAVLFRVVNTEPDLSGLPDGIRHLVAGCLAKNPQHRPSPRQLVELVERIGRPDPAAGWLPPAVVADVLVVRGVLTALPEPSPAPPEGLPPEDPPHLPPQGPPLGQPPPPFPADRAPRDAVPGRRPSRRAVLLGVGGGVLAAAGAATTIALLSDHGGRTDAGGAATAGASSGTPTALVRPSGADVPEARPNWQVTQQKPCPQVLSADGVVVCVSIEQIWGVDDAGRTKWTVDSTSTGSVFAADPNTVRAVAALDGGRLYASGWTGSGTELLAFTLADGKLDWRVAQDRKKTMATSFVGIRAGKAYLLGIGDGKDHGAGLGGGNVWAVDLAARKSLWFHGEDTTPIQATMLPGDRIVVSDLDQLKALDAKGEIAWARKLATYGIGTAGKYVLAPNPDGTLTALDPDASGSPVWTVSGVTGASKGGGGFAAGEDGTALYFLWKDTDGGHSVGTLDTSNGRTGRRAPLPLDSQESAAIGSRILCADGNLYRMGSDAVLWALDPATGKARWKYSGLKGKDTTKLAWTAGAGRLCVSDTITQTITSLPAKGS